MSMSERNMMVSKEQYVESETEQHDRMSELPELAVELRNLGETQSGLEYSLVSGFQAIVDQCGAERVVDALTRHDVASMPDVLNVLAPNKAEKERLFAAMRTVSLEKTFAEMNDKAGGAQNFDELDQAERFRDVEIASLEGGNPTTNSDYFLTGFYHVAMAHPELVGDFVATNDATTFLGNMRKVQGETYGSFTQIGTEATEKAAADKQQIFGEIATAQDQIEVQYAEIMGRLEESLEEVQAGGSQYQIDSIGIALKYQQHSLEENRARFNEQRAAADARADSVKAQLDQLPMSPPMESRLMTNQAGLVLEMRDGKPTGVPINSFAT